MSDWPELSVERDHRTLAILHLASQMLGKIRVAHAPGPITAGTLRYSRAPAGWRLCPPRRTAAAPSHWCSIYAATQSSLGQRQIPGGGAAECG